VVVVGTAVVVVVVVVDEVVVGDTAVFATPAESTDSGTVEVQAEARPIIAAQAISNFRTEQGWHS
jgi:hypothetical protein